jgi:hypothetical protein
VKDIVPIKKRMRRRARGHGLAGLAVFAVAVIAGVVVGWGVSPGETVEFSPADAVALRFPPDWNNDAPASAALAPSYSLASAESRPVDADVLFTPHQMGALPAGTTGLAPLSADGHARLPPTEFRTSARLEPKADLKAQSSPVPQTPTAGAPTRSLAPAPEKRPAPLGTKDSGMLFNDAQLASIKSRLRLSPYQEQYWPPVASALRDIGWRAAHATPRGGNAHAHLAEIDPDSPEVQRLKSAAFPLIMSMNDEQKREVRALAQVMGLERVAASF